MKSGDISCVFFFFFLVFFLVFFFKQKTAYEIKECDWSSDVCSSDLHFDIKAFPFFCLHEKISLALKT